MKQLPIMLEEELDAALEQQALAAGSAKAALIRQYIRERFTPLPPLENDPLWQMQGADDFAPVDLDEVVYR